MRLHVQQQKKNKSIHCPACPSDLRGIAVAGCTNATTRVNKTPNVGLAGKETAVKSFNNLLVKLATDDNGGEVLEYALIAGLIVVAAIASITSIGTKVLARWTSLNASM